MPGLRAIVASVKPEPAHSKFSASSAYRWLACPGSIRLCEKITQKRESEAATEGTLGHEPLDFFLKNGPHKVLASEQYLRKQYDLEMVIHAANAAKTIWKMAPKDAEVLSEEKVKLSHIDPDFGGTLDASIVEHFGTLDVIDYKFGKHVAVEVTGNAQMLVYAIGKAHQYQYNFERVRLTIIQPRAHHADGPIRTWTTPIETLFEWNSKFQSGIKAAKRKDAPLSPGNHCFFCDAKKICPKYTVEATKEVRAGFAKPRTEEQIQAQLVLDFGPVSETKKRKDSAWKRKKTFSAW